MSAVRSGKDKRAPQARGSQRGEEKIDQKPPSTASAPAAPSPAPSSSRVASEPGSNHVDATNKRIIGVTSGPKRATRASTGAHIPLTAKGSLYKAHKDTGASSEDETGRPSHSSSSGSRASGSSNVASPRGVPNSRSALSNTGAVGGRKLSSGGSEAEGSGRGGRAGGGGASGSGAGGRGATGVQGSRGSTSSAPASTSSSSSVQSAMEQSTPSVASAPSAEGGGRTTATDASAAAGISSRATLSSGAPTSEVISRSILTTAGVALGGVGVGGGMAARAAGGVGGSEEGVLEAPTAPRRRRGRKGRSIYRGVCVTREGKWRAVIYKERKQLYLGVYESELEAAKAHDRAARFHFPDKSMTNFATEAEADMLISDQEEQKRLQMEVTRDLAPLRGLGRGGLGPGLAGGGGPLNGGRASDGRMGRGEGLNIGHLYLPMPEWRSPEYVSPLPRGGAGSVGGGVGGGRHISAGDVSSSGVSSAVYGGVRGSARTAAEEAYGSWHGNGNGNGNGEVHNEDFHHRQNNSSNEGSYIGQPGLPDRRDMPGAASGVVGWGGTNGGSGEDWGAKYDGDCRSWRGDGAGGGSGGAGRGRQGERWPDASDRAPREEVPHAVPHAVGEAGVYGGVWEGGRGVSGGGGVGGSRGGYEFFYARFPEYHRGGESAGAWHRYGGGGSDGRDGEGMEERDGEGRWQQQQQQQQQQQHHENHTRGVGRSPREGIHAGGSQRFGEAVGQGYDPPFAARGGEWREGDAGERGKEGFQQGGEGKLRGEGRREEGDVGSRHGGHPAFMQLDHVHGKGQGQEHDRGGVEERRRRLDAPAKEEELPSDQVAMEAAGYTLAHRLGFRNGRDAGDGHGSEQSGPGGVGRGGFRWDSDASRVASATATADYDRRGQERRFGDGGLGGSGSGSGSDVVSSSKHFGGGPRSNAWARRDWGDLGVGADPAMLAAAAACISPADGAGGGERYSPGYHDRYVGAGRSPSLPAGPSNGGNSSSGGGDRPNGRGSRFTSGGSGGGGGGAAAYEGGHRFPTSHDKKKDEEGDRNQGEVERRWGGGGNGVGISRKAPVAGAEDGNFAGRKRGDGDSGGGGTVAAAKRPRQSLAGGHESRAPREDRGGGGGGGGGGPHAGSPPEARSNGTVERGAGLGKPSVSAKVEETATSDGNGNVYFEGRGNRRNNGCVPSDGNGHRVSNNGGGGGKGFSGIFGYDDHDETHREAAAAIASLSRAPVYGGITFGVGGKRRMEGGDGEVTSKKASAVKGRS